jgi:hypothetical protein
LQDLVDAANTQMPFRYRVDSDGDAFTLVATQTRDEQGRSMTLTPLLDRHVTIPLGTRTIAEHVMLLTRQLEEQTGIRVDCGRGVGRWGRTIIPFEARDEPARRVLLRLIRSEPGARRLIRSNAGAYQMVQSAPGRFHWLMRCQPAESWCAINIAPIPDEPTSR